MWRKQHEIPERLAEPLPLLETILLAILAEDADESRARELLGQLKEAYVDWNELRVSPVQEISEHLGDLPDAAEKARRLKRALHHIFESVYSFDIDDWAKKGIKYIEKQCGDQDWFTPHVRARIVRDRIRRNALPVDETILRVWRRIGVDSVRDDAALRRALEQAIPADESYGFEQSCRMHGLTVCLPDDPQCEGCWIQQTCRYAAEQAQLAVATTGAARKTQKSRRARSSTRSKATTRSKASTRKQTKRSTGKRSRKRS